jgi:hypothetical protein
MSQTLKTAKTGGDAPKKQGWIDRVLRRKKQQSPPPEKTVDPAEFNMAQDFGDLLAMPPFRDFPPTLRAKLRAPVETAFDNHDLVAAAREIQAFKSAVAQAGPPFLLWQAAAGRVLVTDRQIGELATGKVADAPGLANRLAAIRQHATQDEFAEAIESFAILEGFVADLHAKSRAWRDKAALVDTVQKQVAEMLGAKTVDAATHKASLDTIEQDAAKGDFVAALKGLTTLAPLAQAGAANARAKLDYEGQRAAMALDEKGVMRIGDLPADLKDLRDKFVAARTKTEDSAGKNDYAKAVESLAKLKETLDAALAARRKAIGEATKNTVDGIGVELDAPGTGNKKVWQDVGSPAWKHAVDGIVGLKVDEEFNDSYDAKSSEVAAKLAKDPIVLNAYDKWSEWSNNPTEDNIEEMTKLMNQVVKLQSEVLGIDPPVPASTFTDTGQPGLCGQFSKAKNTIELNTANAGFKDFRELLDTLTHENTHAYQAKLIKQLDDGTLKLGDPEYNAAMIFKLNTNKGYITSSESATYPEKKAYDNQPKEVHAWRAGRVAGQTAFDAIKQAKTGV